MAGDWIKVEHCTPDKPEVIMMADFLGIDQDTVTGKLFRFWSWADQNSIDGNDLTVTFAFLDRITFCKGFASALLKVGWLKEKDGKLMLPNFDRHNGQTAKNRAVTNRRVSRHRKKCNAVVTEEALQKSLPEKRREEYIERERACEGWKPELIDQIASAYPRQSHHRETREAIMAKIQDGEDPMDMLQGTRSIAHIIREFWPAGGANRFIPAPPKFFRGERWKDDPETWKRKGQDEYNNRNGVNRNQHTYAAGKDEYDDLQ